jgi:uncharacterized protein YodC (DUF2158 family)
MPGDLVTLKSGGKTMTINQIHENGQINCVWMLADGTFQSATLYSESLKLYRKTTVSI